jgi:hypothetical protein
MNALTKQLYFWSRNHLLDAKGGSGVQKGEQGVNSRGHLGNMTPNR